MATIAVAATGTLLKIGDGGGTEVFTTIAEVKDISGPEYAVGITDVTAHDTGPYHQKISSLIDAGQVTFDINFNNHATQGFTTGLYNDMANRTRRNFQIVLTTTVAKTGSFAALVTGYKFNMPVDGALTASLTLEIVGGVVWT
jgi:predicted secreted protein